MDNIDKGEHQTNIMALKCLSNYRIGNSYKLLINEEKVSVIVADKGKGKLKLKLYDGTTAWYKMDELTPAKPKVKKQQEAIPIEVQKASIEVEKELPVVAEVVAEQGKVAESEATPVVENTSVVTQVAEEPEPPAVEPVAEIMVTDMTVTPCDSERTEIMKENIDDLRFTFNRFKRIIRFLLKNRSNVILDKDCTLNQIISALNQHLK